MRPILVDTCAVIWLASDSEISEEAMTALDQAAGSDVPLYVSPITAWEIGMLASKERLKLLLSPERWFERFIAHSGAKLADMAPAMLIASSFLPGKPPSDPADRIIVATARDIGATLLTRDRMLLDYAKQGHVRALAC